MSLIEKLGGAKVENSILRKFQMMIINHKDTLINAYPESKFADVYDDGGKYRSISTYSLSKEDLEKSTIYEFASYTSNIKLVLSEVLSSIINECMEINAPVSVEDLSSKTPLGSYTHVLSKIVNPNKNINSFGLRFEIETAMSIKKVITDENVIIMVADLYIKWLDLLASHACNYVWSRGTVDTPTRITEYCIITAFIDMVVAWDDMKLYLNKISNIMKNVELRKANDNERRKIALKQAKKATTNDEEVDAEDADAEDAEDSEVAEDPVTAEDPVVDDTIVEDPVSEEVVEVKKPIVKKVSVKKPLKALYVDPDLVEENTGDDTGDVGKVEDPVPVPVKKVAVKKTGKSATKPASKVGSKIDPNSIEDPLP